MRVGTAFRALFLAAALINCATVALAADYKIGYIDSERVFREFTGTKSAESEFNQDLEGWVRQFENKKTELAKLEREFEAQKLMLSDARRKEKESELQARYSELEQLQREIWGPTGKAAQRNEQLTKDIITRIREVTMRIALAEGYTFIFDAADGNLVYGDPSLDLTDRVLGELNQATGTTTPK
ncbi:MAG: OmpH family outer membrane protein [Candidatus Eisenbacteria bacterium]|nr:OmpH family outer membrane protein [Candidatus Eisenbacteria bacterium]